MLTLTVLHEFVHFARDANGKAVAIADVKGMPREAGWHFVNSLNPNGVGRIDPSTAKEWLKYYNISPKN